MSNIVYTNPGNGQVVLTRQNTIWICTVGCMPKHAPARWL